MEWNVPMYISVRFTGMLSALNSFDIRVTNSFAAFSVKVAIIISDQYEAIANMIFDKLDRGVTYLNGEGAYSRSDKKVILTAVKKHQMADLKRMVSELDANAFVIVQEAHQVLGDGFSHYTKESL